MAYAPLLPRTPGAGFVIAAMPYKRQKIAISVAASTKAGATIQGERESRIPATLLMKLGDGAQVSCPAIEETDQGSSRGDPAIEAKKS